MGSEYQIAPGAHATAVESILATNLLCNRTGMRPTLAVFFLFSIALLLAGCGPPRVSVGLAGPPVCPYGYYEVPPYNCAPDGYYGPEWFNGGIFIGAGPWYHGSRRFYGHVDHSLDFRQGYRGPLPARGETPRPQRAPFRGQAMHDPRGREAPRSRR